MPQANVNSSNIQHPWAWTGWGSWISNILGRNKNTDRDGFYITLGGGVDQYNHDDIAQLIIHGYVTNPHVYSVVNNMSTALLQIPWYVYDIKDQKAFRRYMAHKMAGNIEEAMYHEHKAVDVFSGTNAATRLLEKPNEKQTWEQHISALFSTYCLTGNAYFYGLDPKLKSSPGLSEVIGLPSQNTFVIPDGNWTGSVLGYQLKLSQNDVIDFSKEEICHIKDYSPCPTLSPVGRAVLGLYGLSPLTPLAKVIRQSNDGYTAQMKLLQHGHPLGILSNASSEPMTEGEYANAQNLFNQNWGGANNKGKVKLTTARLNWLKMGFNSVDLDLGKSQPEALSTVCAVYGLPAPNITGQNANFNTSKEGEKQKWNDAILPRLNPLVDMHNRYLRAHNTLKPGQFLDYDHRAVPSLQQDRDRFVKSVLLMQSHGNINKPTVNRMLGNEDIASPHDSKWLISNQLRFTDEPAPGRTDVNNNQNEPD